MSLCLVIRWFSALIALFIAFSITPIKILRTFRNMRQTRVKARDRDLFFPFVGEEERWRPRQLVGKC